MEIIRSGYYTSLKPEQKSEENEKLMRQIDLQIPRRRQIYIIKNLLKSLPVAFIKSDSFSESFCTRGRNGFFTFIKPANTWKLVEAPWGSEMNPTQPYHAELPDHADVQTQLLLLPSFSANCSFRTNRHPTGLSLTECQRAFCLRFPRCNPL